MQWVQDTEQSNVHNLNTDISEIVDISGTTRRNIRKLKLIKYKLTVTKNIRYI